MLILGASEVSLGLHVDLKGDTVIAISSIYSQGQKDIMVFFFIGMENERDSHGCVWV